MLSSCRSARTFRAILAAWMAVVWTGLDTSIAQTNSNMDAVSQRAAEFMDKAQKNLVALEDGLRDAPRDRWDPQYIVDTVGIEQQALFDWVNTSVMWVPYRGNLRGAMGVLMDRRGNSLDQAVLLGSLLKLAGHDVRLAHADLSADAGAALWQKIKDDETKLDAIAQGVAEPDPTLLPPPVPEQPEAPDVETVAATYGIDGKVVKANLERIAQEGSSQDDELTARVLQQGEWLLSKVDAPDSATAVKAAEEKAIIVLRDHWWVQVQAGGSWTSMDPVARDAIGQEVAPASATYALEELPAELTHRVKFRVIAETWKAGATAEHVVLEHDFVPSQLIGKRISMQMVPMDWPTDFTTITPNEMQNKLFAALVTQREWMPTLDVGDEQYQQFSVYDTGLINEKPSPSRNAFLNVGVPAAGAMGQVGDLLDGIMDSASGDGESPPPTAEDLPPQRESEFTAEWLEFQVMIPGQETRTIRREMFDLIGPARRAKGDFANVTVSNDQALDRSRAQLAETQLVLLPTRLAPEYLEYLAAATVVSNREFFDDVGSDPFGATQANAFETFSKMKPVPSAAYGYAALRFENELSGDAVFIDQPMIIAQHGLLVRGQPGEMVVKVALDVVANEVGVHPFAPDAFAQRVVQGVIDTNAEAIALQTAWPSAENTSQALLETGMNDAEWTLLKPGEEARLASLGISPDVAARVQADLATGKMAIVASGERSQKLKGGYWRVDPKTGDTLGIGENGWGTSLIEYAFVLIIQALLTAIACTAFTAAAQTNAAKATGKHLTVDELKADAKQCAKEAFLGLLTGLVATTAVVNFNKFRIARANARNSPPPGSKPPGYNGPNNGGFNPGGTRGGRPGPGASANGGNHGPGGPSGPGPGPGGPGPGGPKPGGPGPGGNQGGNVNPKGPYQTAKDGKEMFKKYPMENDPIGPYERLDHADVQAKKTYDRMRERGFSDAEANKWSEASWKDGYKNYYNHINPGQPAPPNPFGPTPLFEPGEGPGSSRSGSFGNSSNPGHSSTPGNMQSDMAKSVDGSAGKPGPSPAPGPGNMKSDLATTMDGSSTPGRNQIVPPGGNPGGLNPFGQTQGPQPAPVGPGGNNQVVPPGGSKGGVNPFGQTQGPGTGQTPQGPGPGPAPAPAPVGNAPVPLGPNQAVPPGGSKAGVNPFGTTNPGVNPAPVDAGGRVQVGDQAGANPFNQTNPAIAGRLGSNEAAARILPPGTDKAGVNPFGDTNPALKVGLGGFADALGGGTARMGPIGGK